MGILLKYQEGVTFLLLCIHRSALTLKQVMKVMRS